jgi:hypothetical protein
MPDENRVGGLPAPPPGVVPTAVDAGAPVITGTLRPRRLSYVVIDQDEYTTESQDYVPIPTVSVTFRVKGKRRTSVVAVFSADSLARADGFDILWVRALLDEDTPSIPSEVLFSGADDAAGQQDAWARCHSYQFIFQDVWPGEHTIAIEFRNADGPGHPVFIHRPCLVVAHR